MQCNVSSAWVTGTGRLSSGTHAVKICSFPRKPVIQTFLPSKRGETHASVLSASASESGRMDHGSTVRVEWNGEAMDPQHMLGAVKFNEDGLVPAITQQWDTGEVLMMAWMSADSIRETMKGGRAVYYSRSRQQLWRKGDTSGQIQVMRDLLLDCDGDTILLKVEQLGVACHTGRRSCFYTAFRPPDGEAKIVADVLMDPKELYRADKQ